MRTPGEVADEQAKAEAEAEPDEGDEGEGGEDEGEEEGREEEGRRGARPGGPSAADGSAPTATRRGKEGTEDHGRTVGLLREVLEHHETGPAASAGDLDADWQRAESSGEETVGGSVSTPDQDRVDEIGHALGVEQPSAGAAPLLGGDAGRAGPALLGARAPGAGQGEQAGRALTGYTFRATHAL